MGRRTAFLGKPERTQSATYEVASAMQLLNQRKEGPATGRTSPSNVAKLPWSAFSRLNGESAERRSVVFRD